MIELLGDLWEWHERGHFVAVTTNGSITRSERAVMGAGSAREARDRFPALPEELGKAIRAHGNHVYFWQDYRLFTFPTKAVFYRASDLRLIARSSLELLDALRCIPQGPLPVIIPKPGCGLGGLRWDEVKPILTMNWDDRFAVIDYREVVSPSGNGTAL